MHERSQNIVFALENIESVSHDAQEQWTMFTLRHAPSFDTGLYHEQLRKDDIIDRFHARTRYPCLNESREFLEPIAAHARIAPFASRVFFLRFFSDDEFRVFQRQARQFGLPTIETVKVDVSKQGLYSKKQLDRFTKMIRAFPFAVAYQCDSLIYSGLLNPEELYLLEGKLLSMVKAKGPESVVNFLKAWKINLKQYSSDPTVSTAETFAFTEHDMTKAEYPTTRRKRTAQDYLVPQVTCTPSTRILAGPEPDVSNRVLRWYPDYQDHFLRVTLADEDKMSYRFAHEVDNSEQIYNRVIRDLFINGLTVGGRHFGYLGYSMSALRSHNFWFINPFIDEHTHNYVDSTFIMKQIGDFSISTNGKIPVDHYPALYPARVAQAFSATDTSILVKRSEVFEDEEDVVRNGFTFTDGVGRISPELAAAVWAAAVDARHLTASSLMTRLPSAFQIRMCGFKGMLVVDYTLEDRSVHFRKSMKKFDVHDWDDPDREWPLEIARSIDRPMLMHLNRRVSLQNNGVDQQVFLKYQRKAVKDAMQCLKDLKGFLSTMEFYGLGSNFAANRVLQMISDQNVLGLDSLVKNKPSIPGFVRRLAQLTNVHVLRELKHHARIPIPGAWTLVGVADEWNMLEENEVYACILEKSDVTPHWISGEVVISRSPTIHPGDAQFATAIGKPPKGSIFESHPLPNVLVFSTKGKRDLPSHLGGGDLDGDIFNIITTKNEDLFMVGSRNPGEYVAIPRKVLDRPVTMTDIADNLVEYIDSDVVGLVATNHLLIADRSDLGLNDPDCLILSEQHSQAVDYPKTGQPVPTRKIPKPQSGEKPDWNAGEWRESDVDPSAPGAENLPKKTFYRSQKAVGKLFRDIKMPDPPEIPVGRLMPAFQRVVDAEEEARPPPPAPVWPARPTAAQRLHPSQYPALASGATTDPRYVENGMRYQTSTTPATSIKIVRNSTEQAPRKGPQSTTSAHSSRQNSVATPPGLSPTPAPSHSSSLPRGPSVPPGLARPPGLAAPPQSSPSHAPVPGMSRMASPPGLSAPPGLSPPPGLTSPTFPISPPPGLSGPPSVSLPHGSSTSQNENSRPSSSTTVPPTASRSSKSTSSKKQQKQRRASVQSSSGNSPAPGSNDNTSTVNGNTDSFFEVDERLRELAKPYADVGAASKELKQEMQAVYARFVIELQHISISLALDNNLTEEELFIGTITAKSQVSRRRRQLTERMRMNVGAISKQLQSSIKNRGDGTSDTDQGPQSVRDQLAETLRRSYAAYFVAGIDAEESVWGAASMCLVALGIFCESLTALQNNDENLANGIGDAIAAGMMENEMQIQDDNS
ncbi:RdRP-domain-containing protein [Clavulina sp. PMI_390]|nr:RdRP-domain-containing protein [Clavulina sp. PMI_390]